MKQSELLDLKLPFDDKGILFLWTTHQFIWDAKELLEKWGYEYKAILVWNKEKWVWVAGLECNVNSVY